MIAARGDRQRRAAVAPDLDAAERSARLGKSSHRGEGQFRRQADRPRALAGEKAERRLVVDVDQRPDRERLPSVAPSAEVAELDVEPVGNSSFAGVALAHQRRQRQRGQRDALAAALQALDASGNASS